MIIWYIDHKNNGANSIFCKFIEVEEVLISNRIKRVITYMLLIVSIDSPSSKLLDLWTIGIDGNILSDDDVSVHLSRGTHFFFVYECMISNYQCKCMLL